MPQLKPWAGRVLSGDLGWAALWGAKPARTWGWGRFALAVALGGAGFERRFGLGVLMGMAKPARTGLLGEVEWSRRLGDELFKDSVGCLAHAEVAVGGLGDRVILLHIQPKATDFLTLDAFLLSQLLNKLIEAFVDAFATMLGLDIDTLNPPDHAVAPVAPFVGDHQAGDNLSIKFSDKVEASLGMGQHSFDARGEDLCGEFAVFGFAGDALVEGDKAGGIGWGGAADEEVFHGGLV